MSQRRTLIGAMIGILTFTILSWVSPSTWNVLEAQLVQGRSAFRIYNPFAKVDYLILEFDEDTKTSFEYSSKAEQKEKILRVITELAIKGAKAINIVADNHNSLELDPADIELALGGLHSKAKILHLKDIESVWEDEEGNVFWLDRKQHEMNRFPLAELLEDVIPAEAIKAKSVIVITPQAKVTEENLNLLINYLDDRWVGFVSIPLILNFILTVFAGILIANLVYWARIIGASTLALIALILGQIAFSLFNLNIETIPFIVSLVTVLLISNFFDLNLIAIGRKEIFQASPDLNTIKHAPAGLPGQPMVSHFDNNTLKEMRAKFFHEQESNYEDIALEFQERSIKSINMVQEKIEELLESETLSERDRIKLTLLKHNFDHMIEEFDAILFNLVPFRFEGSQGLINLLELYASKIFLLSKGKLQISIETEFSSLRLELDQKINTYRIIQKLIELIKTTNEDRLSSGLNIAIDIHSDENNQIRFRITYEGLPVDPKANNFKLSEIYKRVDGLDGASIDFGNVSLKDLTNNLINHIDFRIKHLMKAGI